MDQFSSIISILVLDPTGSLFVDQVDHDLFVKNTLVGIHIDEKVAKSQTPRFIEAALKALVNGGSVRQAYRQAWQEFYTLPLRDVEQQPHIITGAEGAYLWVARGNRRLRVHHAAIERFNATIDPAVRDALLSEFPQLHTVPLTGQ